MPPVLAIFLFGGFVIWIFRHDFKLNRGASRALWAPFAWFAILGSRSLKEWLYGVVDISGRANTAALQESNADRILIAVLIVIGLVILTKRSFKWESLLSNHVGLALFFLYCFVSIAWADTWTSPILQWHRMFLSLLMVLVVYSDPDPDKALNILLTRLSYLLIPLSVLFVKYFPTIGRQYSQWGLGQITGVTNSKNLLGHLCITVGMFFVYSMIAGQRRKGLVPKRERVIAWIILAMTGWLMYRAETSNALVAGMVGMTALVILQLPVARLHFTSLVVTSAIVLGVLLLIPGFFESVVGILGEDTTMTGRTELWEDVLAIEVHPLIGAGFENFWTSSRVAPLWARYWWLPNQAHNAYIEVYLNMGYLGLVFLGIAIIASYLKARKQLLLESPDPSAKTSSIGRLKLAFLMALVFYGYAEAVFRPSSFGFLLFLLAAVQYVAQEQRSVVSSKWRSSNPRTALASRPYRYTG